MPRFFCTVACSLLTAVAIWAAPAPPTPVPVKKGPTAEQIQKAIDNLGNGRFAVRQSASKFLWEAGAAGEEALRAAAKSSDEETANRAKSILEKFDWGIYPDTPANVVKLVEKFRGGDSGVRQQVVGELIRTRPIRFSTLRKVIAHEQNEAERQRMYRSMSTQARRAVPGLIVVNHLDEASELLEICLAPANPSSLADYAAFQYLRNRVPDAIKHLEALRTKGSAEEYRRMSEALVYLYRLQKDWPAARKAATAANNKDLENDVAWEANDWKTLSEAKELPEFRRADFRGEQAAYYRLAGNKAKYDEIMDDLRKDLVGVEGDDATAFVLAHALLLNGHGADAIKVLKDRPKSQPDLAFDMLAAQLKFREAFALADQAAKELPKDESGAAKRDALDLQRGKVLAALGDRDAATQVFRGLIDRSLAAAVDSRAIEVVKAAARAGMHDLAAECAARALAFYEKNGLGGLATSLFDPFLGEKKFAAQVWWNAYRRAKPDESPITAINLILELANGTADKKKVDHLVALLDKLRDLLKRDDKGVREVTLFLTPAMIDYAIAEAYRSVGVNTQAEQFYKKAADSPAEADNPTNPLDAEEYLDDESESSIPNAYRYLLAYADFLLSEKRSSEAAAQYRKAWLLAPSQPLPLYLQGFALGQAGKLDEGKRLMELAHWVPLSDDGSRTRFADDLFHRMIDADSRREMDLIVITAWFRTHYVGNVLLRVARTKARHKDYATAALYYEKDVISLFRTAARFIEPRAYLTVPELARMYRAKALFAAGKIDQSMAEVRAGLEALPGNVEMAIGFVPQLDRAGRKKEADEIYRKVKAAFEGAIADYGFSADLRNSLAWTMVNCNRDLDEAQKHAEKAIERAPKSRGLYRHARRDSFPQEGPQKGPYAHEAVRRTRAGQPLLSQTTRTIREEAVRQPTAGRRDRRRRLSRTAGGI